MPPTTVTFGPFSANTYTFLIVLAIFVSVGFALRRERPNQRLAVLDILLGGLIGGIVLARGVHVGLNWAYFAYNTGEITQIQDGGLDWHGAVIGAIIGMFGAAHIRNIRASNRPSSEMSSLLERLTIALPLIALGAWGGCWAAGCNYGAEVTSLADYPSWMVWEGPDIFGIYAPRFFTQAMGIGVSIALLMIVLLLFWRGWWVGQRFWLILLLLSGAMFLLGFLRGDYALVFYGLRADQWLDGILMGFAGVNFVKKWFVKV